MEKKTLTINEAGLNNLQQMGTTLPYLMYMGKFGLTDSGLSNSKKIETYGSKKVGIWYPDTWKEKCKIQPKQGRNQPCKCGSGKKYKNCCALKNN